MQVLGEDALPGNYLGGKYAQQKGKIFADEAWKRDEVFLRCAIDVYGRLWKKLNPLLAALNYGNSKQMIEECEAILDGKDAKWEALTAAASFSGISMSARCGAWKSDRSEPPGPKIRRSRLLRGSCRHRLHQAGDARSEHQ